MSTRQRTFDERWKRLKKTLRVRPCQCRACDHEVNPFYDVCPNCGAGGPVRMPRWVGYVILGLMCNNLLIWLF